MVFFVLQERSQVQLSGAYGGTESCPSLVYVSMCVYCKCGMAKLFNLIVEATKNGHVHMHIIASEIVAVWGLVIEFLCYDSKIST